MKKKIDHKAALELAMQHGRRDPDIAERIDGQLKGLKMSNGRGWACKPERWKLSLNLRATLVK